MFKRLSLSMLAIGMVLLAKAQVSITTLATPYTQNFNTLSNDTTFASTFAIGLTGWEIFEKGTSAVADQKYKVNNGSRTAGDTYSYGDSVTTERALGTLGSGTNKPSFGVAFQNNTGGIITDLTVSYKGEQWRSGDTCMACLDSMVFEYSTTATSIGDTLASWNAITSLMLNTINLSMASAGALPGNDVANSTNKTGAISVLIPVGGKILLRWRDVNKASSDDALAIDDLSVTFAASGNPKPSITATSPADDATSVNITTSSLSMTFDQPVVVGTGNIKLTEVGGSTQTIACGTTTIAGAVVTVPGITLVAGKQYVVNFDSTCYKTGSGANSYGIYDNTSWNFETKPNGLFDYTENNISMKMLDQHNLFFSLAEPSTLNLSIVDLNGRQVLSYPVKAMSGENIIKLNSAQMAKGIYIIRLSGHKFNGVLKFVQQ